MFRWRILFYWRFYSIIYIIILSSFDFEKARTSTWIYIYLNWISFFCFFVFFLLFHPSLSWAFFATFLFFLFFYVGALGGFFLIFGENFLIFGEYFLLCVWVVYLVITKVIFHYSIHFFLALFIEFLFI